MSLLSDLLVTPPLRVSRLLLLAGTPSSCPVLALTLFVAAPVAAVFLSADVFSLMRMVSVSPIARARTSSNSGLKLLIW